MIELDRPTLYKKSGVYQIKNEKNNKIYIGSSINLYERLITHVSDLRKGKHPNSYLQRSWNKYGEDHFDISILDLCDKEKVREKEQYYINTQTRKCDKTLSFNINPDVLFGTISEETKQKIRSTLKSKGITPPSRQGSKYPGRSVSEETKQKIRLKLTGTKLNKETIEKIKATKQKNNTFLCKEETKKKMSLIAKEQRRKPPAPKSSVIQQTLDGIFIKKFNSLQEAAIELNRRKTGNSDISAACRGRQKTAFGYKWEYADEKNV